MALITCQECGKNVSNKAKSCPNCGFPISCKDVVDDDIHIDTSLSSEDLVIQMMDESSISAILEYVRVLSGNKKNSIYQTIIKDAANYNDDFEKIIFIKKPSSYSFIILILKYAKRDIAIGSSGLGIEIDLVFFKLHRKHMLII